MPMSRRGRRKDSVLTQIIQHQQMINSILITELNGYCDNSHKRRVGYADDYITKGYNPFATSDVIYRAKHLAEVLNDARKEAAKMTITSDDPNIATEEKLRGELRRAQEAPNDEDLFPNAKRRV